MKKYKERPFEERTTKDQLEILKPMEATYKGIEERIGVIQYGKIKNQLNALVVLAIDIGYKQAMIEIDKNQRLKGETL